MLPWVISYGIYPLTEIMKTGETNLKKTNTHND